MSYIISGEDKFFFHVSSTKSCEKTNTDRFAQRIVKALADIKALFEDLKAEQKVQKNGGS